MCHINSILMTSNREQNRAPLTLLAYFSLSDCLSHSLSVFLSPDCPVCSGNLCGEIRPDDRGFLQEGETVFNPSVSPRHNMLVYVNRGSDVGQMMGWIANG